MNITEAKLAEYIHAATDLAESLAEDIQVDGQVSETTILSLNRFSQAALEVSELVDMLDGPSKRIMN